VRGEFELYPEPWDPSAGSRRREAVLFSVLLHVVGVLGLIALGKAYPPPPDETGKPRRHISLFLPPPEVLTQKEPNRAPPSKIFLGAPELPRPPLRLEPGRAEPPSAPKGRPVLEEKPPQLVPKPEAGTTLLAQVMPPQPPAQPPKLVLEDAHGRSGGQHGSAQLGALAPQRPGEVIEGAVRDVARNPGLRGTVVGDGFGGGVPGGSTIPTPGNAGSQLELLSDPLGVDFKPYLTRILAAVRRNWYAVIPESARLGMVRGRVVIQFAVVRAGAVSKLVIAGPSGIEALDRAAIAGISASNPFPPLPPEFRGDHVRLQFTFLYNIPVR
jgi:TonB family protein